MFQGDCLSHRWAFASASRLLFEMKSLEKSRLCFDYKKTAGLFFFFFFFPVYKSTQTSRWRDHETAADSTFLSGVFELPLHWLLPLFILPTCYEKSTLSPFSVLESAWTLFTTKSVPRWQILFPPLTLWYAIAAVRTSLLARSPDPIDSWLTFTLKANHAINTVMFYFH